MKLVLGLVDAFPVLTVDDEHEALGAGVVVSPQGTDLVLPANVPDVELDVLVCHGLHVEANCVRVEDRCSWQGKRGRGGTCWDCGHRLVQLELVENGWGGVG